MTTVYPYIKRYGGKASSDTRAMIRSPVREDKTPSCSLTIDASGRPIVHDFGGGDWREIQERFAADGLPNTAPRAKDDHGRPKPKRSLREALHGLMPLDHTNLYARDKGIQPARGLYMLDHTTMAVTLWDENDNVRNIEWIYYNGPGTKRVWVESGRPKKNTFFIYHGTANMVWVAEGISDASAIHSALGVTVMSAGSVNNLLHCVHQIRHGKAVIAAQNCDAFREKREELLSWGALPIFPPALKDWCDIFRSPDYGPDYMRERLGEWV